MFTEKLERLHPHDREAALATFTRCTAENLAFDIEYRVVWPDGQIRYLAATGEAQQDPTGQRQYVGMMRDTTARHKAEAEAQQLRRRQQYAILRSQEEERRRIAESLHNSVGQLLYATRLQLDNADQLAGQQSAKNLLTKAIRTT